MGTYRVVICGSGPIALATARLLEGMDFDGILVAPRESLPGRPGRRLPVRRVACAYSDLGRHVELGDRDFVVIATRVQRSDRACLREALSGPAGFVALVSSRSRWEALGDALRREGVPRRALGRVRCPAGLDIGSITPDEIGLSIVSQLVQERAKRLFGSALSRRRPGRAARPKTSPREGVKKAS